MAAMRIAFASVSTFFVTAVIGWAGIGYGFLAGLGYGLVWAVIVSFLCLGLDAFEDWLDDRLGDGPMDSDPAGRLKDPVDK